MRRFLLFSLTLVALICGCNKQKQPSAQAPHGREVKLSYAQNIRITEFDGYTRVELKNPWKKGKTLHTYYLIYNKGNNTEDYTAGGKGNNSQCPSDGTPIHVPLQRAVVFTTAHANLLCQLHAQDAIAGVADLRYMMIDNIQQRARRKGAKDAIADCGDAMKPNVERIVDLRADAVLLSPFENSGGYGTLEHTGIPLIECAEYMETSALGRAEWMRFYGRLVGKGHEADSLFRTVERNYRRLAALARTSKTTKSVIPDRKTGSVWYMPGGKSSVGLLYKDAQIGYAFAQDKHSGSLALPFETVMDKAGNADIWLMSHHGEMTRSLLEAEFEGYKQLKAFQNGNIYGCQIDKVPYFEEVSWRPDWLLRDLIVIFHPALRQQLGTQLRYYKRIQ